MRVLFDNKFEKHGFTTSNIKIPDVSGFKSVKSVEGAMSFHMCNGITEQTIDIVEDRRLDKLIKYFFYYNYSDRSRIKFIIIDMYSPYVSLIKKMFLLI